jgi:hypothetical protein
LSSAAAFHNMLANSQNFVFQKINGYFPSQDDAIALTHHQEALRLAGEMMKRPGWHGTDEAIGIILSFMAHQVSILSSVSILFSVGWG